MNDISYGLMVMAFGYITLGQPSTTLSGGEAQRVKLATELAKRDTGNTLYILDEPTTGLHFEDIKVLMDVLNKLVDKGNTVLIIEHNLDVIKMADYIIDMGPEGGSRGGMILCQGSPEELSKRVQKITAEIYDLIEANGIIRVDYIVTKENEIYMLEINTTPGMTATSFIPQQIRAAELEIGDVMTDIIENSINKLS